MLDNLKKILTKEIGQPKSSVKKISKTMSAVFIVCFVGMFFLIPKVIDWWLGPTPTHNNQPAMADDTIVACTCAQEKVKTMLKAPGTAKFSEVCSKTTQHINGNSYLVVSYVDAQNSFGAQLRNQYHCEVSVLPGTDTCIASCQFSSQ